MYGKNMPRTTNYMGDNMGRIDLHVHSLLSDGELLPSEIARRAEKLGYEAIAITDHVDLSNLELIGPRIVEVANELNRYMNVRVIPGVELTHVPVATIDKLAGLARKLGAELVLVHGETIVEPVYPGTNDAAIACTDVDILAHPGLLTIEQAEKSRENGIYLELTAKQGHCLANGWIAKVAEKAGSNLLVNTDAHGPDDLLTLEEAFKVARGAGLDEDASKKAVIENPKKLVGRI